MNTARKNTERHRARVAARVRELRQGHRWTQADLADRLGISQGQLSKLERGESSFTAEQFLELLRIFNVPATDFVQRDPDMYLQEIHNALARHGATHLWESDQFVPGDHLEDVALAVQSALAAGDARLVTGVAPVLVRNVERISLEKLAVDLSRAGLERRLWWVVDSTLQAIDEELQKSLPRAQANLYRRSQVLLSRYLDTVAATERGNRQIHDILDPMVRTKASVAKLIQASSSTAQRWGIVTSIQPRDFILALRAARVVD